MPTDRRSNLYQAYQHAGRVVGAIEPAQLANPTPCPAFDVAKLVDHLVGAGHRAAALGHGAQLPSEEFPHVELADAPLELDRARGEATTGWSDDARLRRTVTMPWGEQYPGTQLVDMYLVELATHSWDLAQATGQAPFEEELAVPALAAARAIMRPEYRNAMGEGEPFGSEVPAPAGATAWEVLAAFMGRRPRAT